MNAEEFNLIKNTVKVLSEAKRKSVDSKIVGDEMPSIIGLKLTNRCNLRCKHCYEWNENGYHHHLDSDFASSDLDFELLKRCLVEIRENKPMFYLWGGEPLIYYKISELLDILSEIDPIMAICTNGHRILEHIEVLKKFSSNLELVIALEGEKENNDKLRGTGSYNKTIEAIKEISQLKKKGQFFAKITVHTMISNENIDEIPAYIRHMEDIGVENLILCFPWYISEECSYDMDCFYESNFRWIKKENKSVYSWHAFKYHIMKDNYNQVIKLIENLRKMDFKINLKIQPDLKRSTDIVEFLDGNSANLKCSKGRCLSVFSRMDILPNGKVTSCKHFPEFIIGDLKKQSISDIWSSSEMNLIRQTLKNSNSPACSKCNNYYLHNFKVKAGV